MKQLGNILSNSWTLGALAVALAVGAGHVATGTVQMWGFVIINIDTLTNRPYFDYVSVGDTMAVAGGTFYYRKDDEFYPALKNGLRMK